jgi:hypothetical protein
MDPAKKALWTKVVADFELSGKTQRAFAEEHQVDLHRLRYWIYALRNASRPLVGDEESPSVKAPDQAAPRQVTRMLPVRVVASPAPKAREGEAELLELALPSGARLRFPAGTDLRYLQQLAAAL